VADFTDLQGNVSELGRFISEELSTQLVIDAKSFNVVERIQLAAILKEHQISISGLVDPATIRKLGQFAGVDAIVTGTLVPFSDSVRLTAKVLDVSTAKVMAVSTAELPRTKAIDDLLSHGIATGGGQNGTAPSGNASRPSNPAKIFSVEQNELLILIKTCSSRGDRIVCSGSVTNKANKARPFQISNGYGSTSAVDNNGNSYAVNQVGIGQGMATELMPDLSTNFYLSFPATDTTATGLSVILVYTVDNSNWTKALFRNVPLSSK
jgi:TolB-like protein